MRGVGVARLLNLATQISVTLASLNAIIVLPPEITQILLGIFGEGYKEICKFFCAFKVLGVYVRFGWQKSGIVRSAVDHWDQPVAHHGVSLFRDVVKCQRILKCHEKEVFLAQSTFAVVALFTALSVNIDGNVLL